MTTLTVVAIDNVITVDGKSEEVSYPYPPTLWAIQWNGVSGHAEWTDGPNTVITEADTTPYMAAWTASVDTKAAEVAAEALAERTRIKTHTELRAVAYPSIAEQLDMLYWDKVNNTALWQQTLTTVKATYPKPT